MGKVDHTYSIDISKSPEEAFAFHADLNNWEHYLSSEGRNGPLDRPIQVGDKWRSTRMQNGHEVQQDVEVTVVDAPERITVKNDSAMGTAIITWEFAAIDGGTRVTHHVVADMNVDMPDAMLDAMADEVLSGYKAALES